MSAVPSSIVPSLRPNISVNRPLNVDASSGVNDSNVCAVICAFARPTTSTCPKTAQPAGWTVDLIASLHVLIDSPTRTTYE